jgi:hypothetical protein
MHMSHLYIRSLTSAVLELLSRKYKKVIARFPCLGENFHVPTDNIKVIKCRRIISK